MVGRTPPAPWNRHASGAVESPRLRRRGRGAPRGSILRGPIRRSARPRCPYLEFLAVLETIWPSLPPAFRDELTLQCVKQVRTSPDECEAFARVVADLIKARATSVKSQWRLADIFGTSRAIARDPRRAAPFFAITYMTVRKAELSALYAALEVVHEDLTVSDASAVEKPPSQAQFAAVLARGLDGVPAESVRCMVAVIADTGIDAWQAPAREALTQHLAAKA